MVQYYLINHRSWKWWRPICFHRLMVSIHNAFVIAKFHLGEIAVKKTWPNFQIFMEDVTRAFPACDVPWHPMLDHKIKWNLKKRKVCFVCKRKPECKRKPGNQRLVVTNFSCVRCQEPFHVHCLADSNIPANVAAEAGGVKAEAGNTTDIEVND